MSMNLIAFIKCISLNFSAKTKNRLNAWTGSHISHMNPFTSGVVSGSFKQDRHGRCLTVAIFGT